MRLFLIIFYLFFLSLTLILIRFNREIKYTIAVLVCFYFSLISCRIFYPWLFGFFQSSHYYFLLLSLLFLILIRFVVYLEPIYLYFREKLNIKSNKKSKFSRLFQSLFIIMEEKQIFCRKIPKTWVFNFLSFCRNTLSKIPSRLLILFFFLPTLVFFVVFIKETLLEYSYNFSYWFFSIALLWQRLYPRFLEFSLGYGNLFVLYENASNTENSSDFFENLQELFICFSKGFWFTRCLSIYPLSENVLLAQAYTEEATEFYNSFFFPARNWFVFVRFLEILKKRLFSLYIVLFSFTVFFLKIELVLKNIFFSLGFFFSPEIFFLVVFLCICLGWIYLNRRLIIFCCMLPKTMTIAIEFVILPRIKILFHNLYFNQIQKMSCIK